jgi:antitoxin PrlF
MRCGRRLEISSSGSRSMAVREAQGVDGNVESHYLAASANGEFLVASLTVTAKGQVTLKRDLLQHLGIKPGERVDFEKLPGGELRVRAARPTGTIDGFLHSLDGKVKRKKPLSIEDINRIAAAGWAGNLDQA